MVQSTWKEIVQGYCKILLEGANIACLEISKTWERLTFSHILYFIF